MVKTIRAKIHSGMSHKEVFNTIGPALKAIRDREKTGTLSSLPKSDQLKPPHEMSKAGRAKLAKRQSRSMKEEPKPSKVKPPIARNKRMTYEGTGH